MSLGACHADIAEPPLLLKRLLAVLNEPDTALVREQSLLHAGDDDSWELQSLGVVQGQQQDTRSHFKAVGIGDERRVIEKLGQRLAALDSLVGSHAQLAQVLKPCCPLFRRLALKHLAVPGEFGKLFQHFRIALGS